MALGPLLLAVRDKLRTVFTSWADESILVMPSAQPPAYAGQDFIAVHGGDWTTVPGDEDNNRGLAEQYGVICTLTSRTPVYPYDRVGQEKYVKALTGMTRTCRTIMTAIDKSTTLLCDWNTYILADGENDADLALEYLRWQSTDPNPIPVDGTWFLSNDPRYSTDPQDSAGYVMNVRFGRASRLQTFFNMR